MVGEAGVVHVVLQLPVEAAVQAALGRRIHAFTHNLIDTDCFYSLLSLIDVRDWM